MHDKNGMFRSEYSDIARYDDLDSTANLRSNIIGETDMSSMPSGRLSEFNQPRPTFESQ